MINLKEKAITLAKKMHKRQLRKTGEPYINHCLNVMKTIEIFTNDQEVLSAAVLHDICEDTELTIPNLSEEFSPRVSFIVNSLTKNQKHTNQKGYDPSYRIKMYLNRFAKGCFADKWIMFIKMADQIDNSQTFQIFKEDKQQRKINELNELFFPIYERIQTSFTTEDKNIYKYLLNKIRINISK